MWWGKGLTGFYLGSSSAMLGKWVEVGWFRKLESRAATTTWAPMLAMVLAASAMLGKKWPSSMATTSGLLAMVYASTGARSGTTKVAGIPVPSWVVT